jgi:hypothetical protein
MLISSYFLTELSLTEITFRFSGFRFGSLLVVPKRFSIYYMIITPVILTIKKVFLSSAVGLFNGLSDLLSGFGFKNKDFLDLGKIFTNNIQLIKVLGVGRDFFELLALNGSFEFIDVLVS